MADGASSETRARGRKSGLARFLNVVANPFSRWALRSRFHGVMSGSVMLVTVTGRKSGRRYTTPVNYVRDGDEVTVVSALDRTWWRNVRGGAPVAVRIQGNDRSGRATVVAEGGPDAIAGYRDFRDKLGHPVSPEKAEKDGGNKVIIRVRLDGSEG